MATFNLLHVALSLIGIGSGFVITWGFITAKRLDIWTAIFLAATILTSVTGFFFPIERFTPGHAVGILSLIALGVAVAARYPMQMAGRWRITLVVSAMISQYFNFAVLIIQSFQKVPALAALTLTLTPTEPVTQLVVLALFIVLTIAAAIRFRPASAHESEKRTNVAALS